MMPQKTLVDSYNRNLNYLRISLTDRCNLKCIYCVPDIHISKLCHNDILRYEEIIRIVKIFASLGVSKVRITGGEPLVRKGIYDFLKTLNDIDGLSDISITTNGVLLKENILTIKACGIKRINISLDTLNRDKFKQITGNDYFDKVWKGIFSALDSGFDPVKINIVALNGINDDEFIDFAKLSLKYPFHIRFIEYMPIGDSQINLDRQILAPEIIKKISKIGNLLPVIKNNIDGPAERYKFEGANGEIGFIRPISQHFCHSCNRLRLTASGKIRVCLLSDKEIDLKSPIRNGCSDSEIIDIIRSAISYKQQKHNLMIENFDHISAQMNSIGG